MREFDLNIAPFESQPGFPGKQNMKKSLKVNALSGSATLGQPG